MKCGSVFALLVVLLSSLMVHGHGSDKCVSGAYPPQNRPKVPTYVINLDLPPQERWNQVGKEKGAEIGNLLKYIKSYLLQWTPMAKYLIDFLDKDLGYLADTMLAPFGDEMKGLAKATGLPLGEIVLYNIFYEIFTVCTSIVAEDSTGKLYHVRNMDFGLFMGWNSKNHSWFVSDHLRPMVMNLDWQKGGKTVFKSVNFAGYIGLLTAIKPGVFTYSMNERFNIDGGYIGILEWILGSRDIYWMSFLARTTLENATSYESAKDTLTTTPMLAPAYFILGGNKSGEGCIITRDRKQAVDVWDMGTRNSTWYLVETNYDHWKPPFILDDRRTPANNCIQKMSQNNVGFPALFDVLSTQPVLNKLTTYAALMQVNSGTLETYLQDCPQPCSGW